MTEAELVAKCQALAASGCALSAAVLRLVADRDRAVESLRTFRRLAGALADRLGAEADALASRAASAAVASG